MAFDNKGFRVSLVSSAGKVDNGRFSALDVAPLLLSQFSALLIITSMPLRVLRAVEPVTEAVKSSTKAIAPPLLLVLRCTRSALKKRNKIRERKALG